ncbi:hypothetical protein LTS18_002177, partial [Coniosporium uncinatum]
SYHRHDLCLRLLLPRCTRCTAPRQRAEEHRRFRLSVWCGPLGHGCRLCRLFRHSGWALHCNPCRLWTSALLLRGEDQVCLCSMACHPL